MAEVISIVDPDNDTGTDYVSLAAWVSGEAGNYGGDDPVAECRSSSGSADTSGQVSIQGFSNYGEIIVRPISGGEHAGVWDASKYRLTSDSGDWYTLFVNNTLTTIHGIQIDAGNSGVNVGIYIAATSVTVTGCIVTNSAAVDNEKGIVIDAASCRIGNNIVYGFDNDAESAGIYLIPSVGWIYNNTVCKCARGYETDWTESTRIWRNNLARGNTSYDYKGDIHDNNTGEYNASSDASATGTGCRASQTFTMVDYTNNDFHLTSGDAGALGYATDLSGDSDFPITDDIDGTQDPIGTSMQMNMLRPLYLRLHFLG